MVALALLVSSAALWAIQQTQQPKSATSPSASPAKPAQAAPAKPAPVSPAPPSAVVAPEKKPSEAKTESEGTNVRHEKEAKHVKKHKKEAEEVKKP